MCVSVFLSLVVQNSNLSFEICNLVECRVDLISEDKFWIIGSHVKTFQHLNFCMLQPFQCLWFTNVTGFEVKDGVNNSI